MATPPRHGGIALHPTPSRAGRLSLGGLVGAGGETIQWPRTLMFLGALIASDMVWVVRSVAGGSRVSALEILMPFLFDVAMAGTTLAGFRLVRNASIVAALVASAAFAVVMVPLRWLAFGASGRLDISWAPVNFGWTFLFLSALVVAVARLNSLLAGLAVGAAVGQVLGSLLSAVVLRMRFPDMSWSWGERLIDLAFQAVSGAVFAGVLWAFLSGQDIEGEAEAPAAAPTGRIGELQQAASYWLLRRLLRAPGIGSILFGAVAIALGSATLKESDLNAILLLLGVLLFFEGIWIVSAPSPAGMIVDGVALVALGLWNLFVTLENASRGASGPHFFAALGVAQIVWGFQSFRRYGRFARIAMARPAAADLRWADEALKGLPAAREASSADIVELRGRTSKRQQIWKGRLFPDLAVFLSVPEEEVIVAAKAESELTPLGSPVGRDLEAQLRLGERSLAGKVSQESLDRFRRWKAR